MSGTWGEPLSPALAADDLGDVLAVWQQATTASSERVYSSGFTPDAGWTSGPMPLSESLSSIAGLDVVAKGEGNVVVAFRASTDVWAISRNVLRDEPLGSIVLQSQNATDLTLPSAAIDALGGAWVAWGQERDRLVARHGSLPGSPPQMAWSSQTTVAVTANDGPLRAGGQPSIGVSASGAHATAVWLEGSDTLMFAASFTAAGGWTDPVNAGSTYFNGIVGPALDMDGNACLPVSTRSGGGRSYHIRGPMAGAPGAFGLYLWGDSPPNVFTSAPDLCTNNAGDALVIGPVFDSSNPPVGQRTTLRAAY